MESDNRVARFVEKYRDEIARDYQSEKVKIEILSEGELERAGE